MPDSQSFPIRVIISRNIGFHVHILQLLTLKNIPVPGYWYFCVRHCWLLVVCRMLDSVITHESAYVEKLLNNT